MRCEDLEVTKSLPLGGTLIQGFNSAQGISVEKDARQYDTCVTGVMLGKYPFFQTISNGGNDFF